eukprot:6034331-Alexandrium_andersonii.AAC.1
MAQGTCLPSMNRLFPCVSTLTRLISPARSLRLSVRIAPDAPESLKSNRSKYPDDDNSALVHRSTFSIQANA